MSDAAEFLNTPLAQISPFDPRALEHRIAFDARMRREAPVFRCPRTGFVFDAKTVSAVAEDRETSSNRYGRFMRIADDADARVAETMHEGFALGVLRTEIARFEKWSGAILERFASLARAELRVGFSVLLQRLDDLHLDCPRAELTYQRNPLLRSLERLPIRFSIRASA